jgi:hypothetical protein
MSILISFAGLDDMPDWRIKYILEYLGHYNTEVSVLFSKSRAGKEQRYASQYLIHKFAAEYNDYPVSKGIHICGKELIEDVLMCEQYTNLLNMYNTVQINSKTQLDLSQLRNLKDRLNGLVKIIIPISNFFADLPSFCDGLVDNSAGKGIYSKLPDSMPDKNKDIAYKYGYAGGINWSNIPAVYAAAHRLKLGRIDMESGCRNSSGEFDPVFLMESLANSLEYRSIHYEW